jgi:hypothetical protein
VTPEPVLLYAEQRGLWHVVQREEYPEVHTVWGEQIVRSAHRFEFEPVPTCWHCGQTRNLAWDLCWQDPHLAWAPQR